MAIKRSNRAEAIIAKLEEMERSHSDASYDTGYAIGESLSDGYDDGVDCSVQKIRASSIKLSNAFKNVRDTLNKQIQLFKSEINDKKFNVKVDFSNIDMNSDAIKRKISNIMSAFKDEDIIEFDAKGSEKQFENLISLYVKYEEKLNSLREIKTFSSNDEAIKNLNEQVVLASKLQEIIRFLDGQTDVSLPMLMSNRELNNIINSSISALERFNAVKEETEKTKVDTGNFKNIEDILKSLKEAIEGIKDSLDPISDIFKNEGQAMQNMAANGTASFNSLSEAVNALYNNLKNVEFAVDAISKKNFEIFDGGYSVAADFGVGDGMKLGKAVAEAFAEGKIGKVVLVYTKFVSMITQLPVYEELLPLEMGEGEKRADAIYDGDPEELLAAIVPEYVGGIIFSSVCESVASESAARRSAMNSANKNAGEIIDTLMLKYNRARQAVITQEITEIVSGADAL